MPAALPPNEGSRLAALRGYRILDTLSEQMFDDIAQLAAHICDTPIALVSLVDEERQWFKARVGLDVHETHRDLAFCAHAILTPNEVMVVPDATQDARFAGNALVTGEPQIRFYAGSPIVTAEGEALGTVCAIDRRARTLPPSQREALRALARQTSRLLEYRRMTESRHANLVDEVTRGRQRLVQLTSASTLSLDLLSFVDRDYVCRYVNDTYLEYWSSERARVEGFPLAKLMGTEVFAYKCKPYLDRALAGERVQYEGEFDYPGRGRRCVNVTCLPARDDAGTVIGAVMRENDIHALKQTQQELQHVIEQLDTRNVAQQRFIYMISHDVREPVNTICNFSGLLETRHADALGPQGRRYLEFVSKGGLRIRSLLDDLLAFVRLDGADLHLVEVDLAVLVEEVVAGLAPVIAQAGARVSLGKLPRVRADLAMMRVLFGHLLSNAIKFHRPQLPPIVEIQQRPGAEGCRVEVSDNGIGIAPEQRTIVFGVFKRLRTRREYEGTGLGLATCKRIMDLHQGHIEVESELGRGTRFTVVFPPPRP